MNDRIFAALQQAGLSTSPQATLDHESAFFALYDSELVYLDGAQPTGAQLSRVPLTEVTRIHSDRDGVLRVETASETSVTASLMGYNPNRVQRFFQQVRDTTARAKQLPVMPMNGAAPTPATAAPSPFATPAAPMPNFNPLRDQPPLGSGGGSRPSSAAPNSAATPPAAGGSADAPTPTSGVLSSGSANPSAGTSGTETSSTETLPVSPARSTPLVISSTPSLNPSGPNPSGLNPTNLNPSGQPPESARRASSRPAVTPVSAAAPISAAVTAPLPEPLPASPALGSPGSSLSARADSVQTLSGPLRFLAVVLGLAALALAYFQWQGGQTLSAIWTLLTGGVSLVALLAFAASLALLADLARELGGRRA